MSRTRLAAALMIAIVALSRSVGAQHQHDMSGEKGAGQLVAPSQAAFATIADVVRVLKADPATDWSKVNLEALRQHLIDMDDVVMRAVVAQRNVPGGMEAVVTGTGKTGAAIQRMLGMHAMMLDESAEYRATSTMIPNGVRLVVTSRTATNGVAVARIRGLGFAGLLTEGDHHARHHLAIARGATQPHTD